MTQTLKPKSPVGQMDIVAWRQEKKVMEYLTAFLVIDETGLSFKM